MTNTLPINSISQLVAISRRYGADPAYCLAGGGNTSVKTEDRLWVKASGHALGQIAPDGFVEMDRGALTRMLAATYADDVAEREAQFMAGMMSARVQPELGQRPSVETLIHHLIPRRFVVHTHPMRVNALTCCVQGQALAQQWLGGSAIWQPYVDPGVTLAQSLNDRLGQAGDKPGPIVVFLENHGLIVAGDSTQEIEQATVDLQGRLEGQVAKTGFDHFAGPTYADAQACLPAHRAAAFRVLPDVVAVSDQSEEIQALVGTEGGRAVALAGPLTPDQIVYCRSMPMWIDAPAATQAQAESQWIAGLEQYKADHGIRPWVVLLAGAGMITVREQAGLAQTTCDVYRDAARVSRCAAALGGVQPMAERDVDFIENWEVESYRRAVAAKAVAGTA